MYQVGHGWRGSLQVGAPKGYGGIGVKGQKDLRSWDPRPQ